MSRMNEWSRDARLQQIKKLFAKHSREALWQV
jgi:hypothetical protein